MATPTYTPISPDLNTFGGTVPKYDGKDTTLFASTSFLWTICFMFIIMAAVYQYIMVGIYRLEPSEQGARKSKEVFKKTTLGLLGVLGLFLLLAALNKTFLTGDVGAPPLQTNSTSSIPTGTAPVTKNEQASQSVNKSAQAGNAGLGKLRPNEPNTPYEARVASHNTICARWF